MNETLNIGRIQLDTPDGESKQIIPQHIYTDGACSFRDGKTIASGYGIYFGDGHKLNVSMPLKSTKEQPHSNNRAELLAIKVACQMIKNDPMNFTIHTDSMYSINATTKWAKSWEKNGWRKKNGDTLKNLELIQFIYKFLIEHPNIILAHVNAHSGKQDVHSLGNQEADRLAVEARNKSIDPNVLLERKLKKKTSAKIRRKAKKRKRSDVFVEEEVRLLKKMKLANVLTEREEHVFEMILCKTKLTPID